jgi:MFS family permease
MLTDQPKPTAATVLKNYNFRLLWIGQSTSLLGDQFFLIAMPWLVLKLTNDPLALGTVTALIGIPRALFMLIGGAVSDRYSPRTVMLVSDLLRLLLVTLLAALVITGGVQLWMLYVLGFIFGLISGFFMPASGAILPQVIRSDELVVGNSIYQGTAQLVTFIGPMLGGVVIALFAHMAIGGTSSEMTGIAAAMAFDAFTFLVSVITLWLMSWQFLRGGQSATTAGIFKSIKEGITFLWKGDFLRTMFLLMVATNFIFAGPIIIGVPTLADTRLGGSAATFGILMGAFGAGNLLGIVVSSPVLGVVRRRMGAFIVAVIASFGIALVLLGFVSSVAVCVAIFFLVGIGNGVVAIALITFLQQSTPKEMLGRVMSLVTLAGVGLAPISQALTGVLTKFSLSYMFVGAGILMLLTAVWLALQPVTRNIHQILAVQAE